MNQLNHELNVRKSMVHQIYTYITLDDVAQESEFDETADIREKDSSEEETIEQECSTDIMFLSSQLKAVIEGSNLRSFAPRDLISIKMMAIARDIKIYLRSLKAQNFQNEFENYSKSFSGFEKNENFETVEKNEKIEKIEVARKIEENEIKEIEKSEIAPAKSSHHSVFSFSSPDSKSMQISPVKLARNQEISLSSEWEISSEIVENDENSNKEGTGKWNSISVISLHSASLSNSSEASESIELLQKPSPKSTQTEFKKPIPCWKRFFCCFCKSSNKNT